MPKKKKTAALATEYVLVRLLDDAPVWSIHLPKTGVTLHRGQVLRVLRIEAEEYAEQGVVIVEDNQA